jgi:glycolate oxidase iron-sulfur subunit
LSQSLDPETVTASINLLSQLGYGVHVPEQQVCCGALHLHDGNIQQAETLAKKNISIFNQEKAITAVVSLVNGCTSQLREYPQLGLTEKFSPAVKDIVEFLAEIEWPENIQLQPLNKAIALQIPCSLQNSLRAEDKLMSLIKRIPQLNIESIYNKCCGAAGSYFLRQAKLSDQLKEQAITEINKNAPEMIISSNLGCALQLKSGLSESKNPPHVIHPVVLLEQQLKYK